ncbi:ABC transporter substrate-binding protein [Rhizobium sp. LC145]|uniref:ABC transporter substrate-binding protein n=1 Tax=Rhizobium sp. LC145 TaxID=1120688 RepID=UPI00062A4AF6|nr:ABC transporter substrate-binding protein [Rhizobium sp. LC145]KKX24871.1 peptide ABC transporter substrate-binding protein [Rhizobium sp. LC145]TKT46750.1 ABC transporter substrate-binding protein [Rhizobiaceae bacterium LC148]
MSKILLASCMFIAMAAPSFGSEIIVALNADIRSNNPGVNRDGNTDGVIRHIVEGLVGPTDNGEIKPLLAERFETSEDGLTYTFTLRDGVKFHNGSPLTADDVVWTFKRYLDPATKWSCLSDFNGTKKTKIESVEAKDTKTVVIKINSPSGAFLGSLSRPECGYSGILSKASINADGTFAQPIGTGPFRWGEWKKSEYITLTKFDDYVSPANDGKPDGLVGSKRPLVDRVKLMIIPDGATVKAGLESGVLQASDIPPSLIPEYRNHPTLQLIVAPNNGKNLFYMQTKDKVLSNPAVRRAMAAALDLDELVAAASNGTGSASASIIASHSAYFSEVQKKRIPYDPGAAKKELEDAGYKGEPITIIANKRGDVPSFPAAVIAQAMMQQVGLNVQIEVLDYATQVERRRAGNYQVISQSVAPRFDPVFAYSFYVGDKSKDPSLMWDDPKAIELMNAAYVERDETKRQAIFDEFHELMLREMPGIFLYDMVDVWGATKKLKGLPVWQSNPRLWEVSIED